MSICSSNVTSGFVDLATFDELEKYMYGGPDATAYFVREVVKATWFTQVPVVLSRATGNAGFGQEWSVSISRAGDYLLSTWLRVTFPAVTLSADNQFEDNGSIRWTRNLMHNLVHECALTFNDLVAARFDSYHLDFWAAFTTPAGKRNGYLNMIGDVDDLTNGHTLVAPPSGSANPTIPSATLNLPLPFFYTRDSGVALPTAALPYNEMRINFTFRDWNQLLILDNMAAAAGSNPSTVPLVTDLSTGLPVLSAVQVWANYAIVSNDERKRMACAPRDILIEQVQTAPRQTYNPSTNANPSFDIRFSHAIKVMFFAVRNVTVANQWSNYTSATPTILSPYGYVSFSPSGAVDPIKQTTLIYENTQRLAQMGSDYFSLVNPWYHAPVIPLETGYHMYSYSLDFICLDPKGSTNYGKLTNVSIVPDASAGAVAGSAGTGATGSGANFVQTYQFITTVVNNNIIRVSGGALGFPVL
jgi:hypothetical protein